MNKFICPYHGWTYGLDGKLLGCTEPDGWECLDKEKNNLPQFEVRTLGPWIFVNLNEVRQHTPISWEKFTKGLVLPPLDFFKWKWQKTYNIKCNWKVFVDNYVDGGYHIPYAHKGLAAVADYSKYEISLEEFMATQTVPLDQKGDVHNVRKGMAYYVWLFPNFMINISDGVMDTNLVIPVDTENCKVVFDFYFTPEMDSLQAMSDSEKVTNQIQYEDILICERVQKGLHSSRYNVGRYHTREAGIYHFHKLLHRFIR